MKADKGGQKRKCVVVAQFDAFMRARSQNARGWGGASDVDVQDYLCWLDSKGSGTTVVHARDCPEVGSKSLVKCEAARGCSKRYAASSLEKGFTSKLKCGMAELLGKTRAWNDTEKTGNPVDSKRVKNYLKCAREEQRAVGVTVNQARPMLAPLLTQIIRYMRRTANGLPTPSERVARRRDIALYVVAFHTAQRGFDLSCALTAQVLKLPDREGLIFNLHFGKSLRDSSHAIVVRRDRECPDLCPVRAIEEFVGVTKSMGWAPSEGYLFPEVNGDGSRGGNKLAAAAMTANLQAIIKRAGLDEGRNYTMHSFRVGGAVSQSLAGTAVEALMTFVGWKSRTIAHRYIGVGLSTQGGEQPGKGRRANGSRYEREQDYQKATELPLQEGFAEHFSAFA